MMISGVYSRRNKSFWVGVAGVFVAVAMLVRFEWIVIATGIDEGLLRSVTLSLLSGSTALALMGIFTADRIALQVVQTRLAEKRVAAIETISGRIPRAATAIKRMAATAVSHPESLPEEETESFSDLAGFCSGWKTTSRNSCLLDEEKVALAEANRAIFDFLLTLELKGSTASVQQAIKTKAQEAINSLNRGAQALRLIH